eukprot:TRINITY_DN80680_c0_g1_i1.p1 TRINITY_DN80680_c0_g1~~TRINITY_DN80680_c0_g1_i1.p1  ORF type:complete len:148 (-),score=44.23 TRINITY_DN80680_c0_g1_i1:58-501(-)
MWIEEGSSFSNEVHVFRLSKGKDLKKTIASYCTSHSIHAGLLISCAGSLATLRIRLAQNDELLEIRDGLNTWEIVSLSGTVSVSDQIHLHMSVADGEGRVLGGHLMDGCEVFTTAEIGILSLKDLTFRREMDKDTGYKELKIEKKDV